MTTVAAFSWMDQPFDGPLDVDLSTEGAEWQHHLSTALREVVSFDVFGGSRREVLVPGGVWEFVEYQARDSTLTSRLWITFQDRRVFIVGDGAEEEAQVSPWVHAVTEATTRMTQQHPTFMWAAVIGPSPDAHLTGTGLAEPATVGPLELRPGGVRHVEYVRPLVPSFSSRGVFQSWPVIVEGTANGYNWYAAQEVTIRDLNRLCALLSVSTDRAWVVRQSPGERDVMSITIPETGPFEQHHGTEEMAHQDVSVPDWLSSAWDVAVSEQLASDALSAYYEGVLIQDEHPSIALLAFVASIEAVGETLLAPERCQCCRAVKNSAERFRRALCLVVSDEEAQALKKRAYGPRSATVHRAQFHGREAVRGAPHLANFFGIEPPYRFEIDTVRQLERVSRQLVQRLLKGEIGAEETGSPPGARSG
jgi:hypothetical protein